MSDSVWYYARGEQEKGPITTVQIKALAGAGKLQADDFVWKEGMENWVPAGEVPGLFAARPAHDAGAKLELPQRQDHSHPATRPRQFVPSEIAVKTRTIGRIVFAVGLLMALFSRGCDTLGDRNVARRKAISESARSQFQNDWNRKRLELDLEKQRLQGNPSRSNMDNKRLEELAAAIGKLTTEIAEQERSLESGRWLENDQAAAKAASDDQIWGYWRQATLLFATALLACGLLGVAYCSDGPERWISFVLLVVIFYSLYTSDSVWGRVFS